MYRCFLNYLYTSPIPLLLIPNAIAAVHTNPYTACYLFIYAAFIMANTKQINDFLESHFPQCKTRATDINLVMRLLLIKLMTETYDPVVPYLAQ